MGVMDAPDSLTKLVVVWLVLVRNRQFTKIYNCCICVTCSLDLTFHQS